MESNILVADDNPQFRTTLCGILRARGYKVTPANDGRHTLQELARLRLAGTPPELIIVDVRMPVLDGCELCRRIKNDPQTCGIPVMLMSAFSDIRERARSAGADAYIHKPFDLYDLYDQATSLLSWKDSGVERNTPREVVEDIPA